MDRDDRAERECVVCRGVRRRAEARSRGRAVRAVAGGVSRASWGRVGTGGRQRREELGEAGPLGVWVPPSIRGGADALDPPADPLDQLTPVGRQVHEHAAPVDGVVRRYARPDSTSLSTTRVAVGAGSAVWAAISPMLRPPPLASISSTRQPSRLTPSAVGHGHQRRRDRSVHPVEQLDQAV